MKSKAAPNREKQHGIVYTPTSLADAVASRLVDLVTLERFSGTLVVADPACGDGALLDAFGRAAAERKLTFQLKGFDTDPAAVDAASERLNHWEGSEVIQRDFLEGRGIEPGLFDEIRFH